MYANLGELQSVLVAASRCLECRDPHCMRACPEQVDVRAAMRVIMGRGPSAKPASWMQQPEAAANSAAEAIETSFENR